MAMESRREQSSYGIYSKDAPLQAYLSNRNKLLKKSDKLSIQQATKRTMEYLRTVKYDDLGFQISEGPGMDSPGVD